MVRSQQSAEGEGNLQAERLAAHRVEVGQRRELVIRNLRPVLLHSRTNLGAQFILDVLTLTEDMKDAR